MNKIYKVMYSKVKQCCVVVSEIAKSHGHNGESSGVRKHAALTAAVLIALGSLSFTTAFVPMTAEAAVKTRTDGSNFVGVERTDGLLDDKDYGNFGGKGANGADSITLGLNAQAGAGTITIGDRNAGASLGSVYVGQGDIAKPKLDTGGWATSIGYNSDATGYGSIALGSNAVAQNSYAKDSKGESLELNQTYVDNGVTKVRLNSKPDIQRASVAIGYGASADNGNIAIGSYSDASTDLRTAKTTDGEEIKSYLTDKTADSYVSVGKSDALRRISNVADGAADSDVATIRQLKALSDKAGVYNEGWGIKIDKTNGNTISVNHNLGNNMNAQLSSTGLILGGDFSNTYDGKYGGAAGDYAVTLGGESNFALGNISVIAGGYGNHASGKLSFIGGGNNNVATGSYSANLGGTGNTASGESSVVTGGAYNTASGTKSFVGGGHGNIAVGDYSAVIGGWDNRALGDPYGSSITTVVGGYRNTANGYHAMVTGGYQNVAWGRDTLVSGGRYNTVLGEMEDGWTDQRLSDASAFGGEGSVVQGLGSVGLAGGSTGKTAYLALAAGYQSVVTDGAAKLEANFSDYEILPVYKDIASAIGYQSTANEAGTISFGHDAGDVSGYTVNWEEDKDPTHDAIDYGSNDYTKTPTVTENHYDNAYYNRLVKVADGIDNHDAVTREQVQYIGGIYGTDKNDSNYGGRGATGTNSVAIGSNAVATEDNVVSFGNPDIPAVNIPESRKITHSVSLSDTDKTAINNVLGFDVTNDENWSKISGFKDWVIVSSLGSATEAQDRQKLANNPEFMELFNKVDTAVRKGTLTQEQWISFEKYANGTEVETTDAVNIPAKAANYRRVVNMADGINPHDAVAMEQLEDYAKTDASNIGNSNENKDDWGEALGVDSLTTAGAASNSNQLITGKTLYNYDKPNADGAYVKLNQTTGQNLSALDTQVKANTDALTKPNHNIKYYAVDETTLPKLTNFNGKDYSNEKNNGAKGMGSIAAGFNTHADGIASTVAGSYSGVINQNSAGLYDLRGATALSYGTFNINQNTDTGKIFSGVANSIVGQANATTDSNAAIIYGAGNTVTNSYRKIDDTNASEIMKAALSKDVKKLDEALQKAVPTSGGQVMVMGGGNNVESAYMTQVVGVGNTVKGNQVYTKDAKTGKWNWTTDTNDETAIEDYDPKKSSQYNYVDGFSNEVINGKHDYIIGANNKLDGDSYDDNNAKPIKRSNKSNVVIGDNHALTGKKNNVIIGSADTEGTLTRASDAVIIGHKANATSDTGADNAVAIGLSATAGGGNAVTIGVNTSAGDNSITIGSESSAISGENIAIGRYAKVYGYKVTKAVALGQKAEAHVADGVAIGSGSIATVAGKSTEGYDPATGQNSTETTSTWQATKAAVSIGTADGKVTRQINGVAAGTNDTDAVNVAQLKKLEGMKANVDASNIGANLKGADGKTAAADAEKTTNENAWGEALGTGTVTKDSKQLVTGSTVYNEVRPSRDGKYVKMSQTTGENLLNLDSQVQTNTDKLSDVDSRSVKYDTKTVNDKTVVDNTKITLAGEGGTTITNLKDGVNANDAATMGQLNDRISGVTYKAGDGIKYGTDADNNKTISVNKGDGLKFTEDHKLAVNTGKHLSVNTNGQIDVGDNGTVAENDGNLVTGDTVYKALNGGMTKMIIGTPGKNGKDGTPGTIGLVGPAGTNGKDGAVDITIQKGEDGKDGTKGANGVDGKDGINRIVYEDKNGKHQVATMEDGLKFAGDDGQNDATKAIAKKLNNTVDIIGGADSTKLTANNIGVNNEDGKLKIQLAKDLKGITSISNQKTEGGKTTGAKITLGDDGSVNVNGGKITNVGSGADASGNYTTTTNAANIGDVQKIVKDAVDSAADTTNKALAGKANVDASNIGANLKGEDGKTPATEAEKTKNENAWGSAIGTGKIEANNGQLVTGKTVYEYNKPVAEDGKTLNYVSEGKTTGQNLGALDAQVKTNADDITNINNSISSLNQNAVKYDDSDKSKISLGGEGGTTITNVKDGALNDSSTDAVNGKQLYAEQTARKELETKVTSNTTEINNIKDGQGFTGKGKEVIRDLAKGSVKVIAGTNTTVTPGTDEDGATTYAVNVEGNGKVASGDTNLISGGTLYNEVHVDKDGTYIKSKDSATGKDMTVAQNLSALDSGLKTTSDLIHTNTAGDTIQIGGSSTATKIDVNGKDGKGRVITGVVSDANDPTSAANVGYVNGVTSANTQQIYRDMNNAYGRLNNNINKAAAGSNALAALHPLDYDPDDKADFAVGYGHYRNANAAAVGAFYHPNENTMVNVGVSLGNGDPGFNAGVSFKVGRGGAGREAMSKTEMAKVINSQSKEIDALKKDNADKDKRIDALEQKMAEILAKLDKNGK